MESATSNLNKNIDDDDDDRSAKRRAEEFDRFMEEDANVAHIVQEETKPGSLVDDIQQCRGTDIVDMEVLLQREAADRRRSREQVEGKELAEHGASSPSPAVVLPTAPTDKINGGEKKLGLPTNKRTTGSLKSKPKSSSSTLLAREQENAEVFILDPTRARAGIRPCEYRPSRNARAQTQGRVRIHPLQTIVQTPMGPTREHEPERPRKLVSDYRTAKQELVLVHAIVRRMACVSNVLSLDYQCASSSRSGYFENNVKGGLTALKQFGTDADLAERAQLKADVVAGLVCNLSERELTGVVLWTGRNTL